MTYIKEYKTHIDMKKYLYLFSFAAMLLGGIACSESDGVDNPAKPESGKVEFTAQFKSLETRVSLNGTAQQWESGDQIVINDTTFTTSESGAKVKFKADKFDAADGEALVALYGKNEIAAKQSAREGNIPAAVPAVAVGEYTSGVELTFSSVASFLKFTPKVSGDICFASADGSELAAMFDIDADGTVTFATDGSTKVTLSGCEAGKSYYVAIAPVTLSAELVITCGSDTLKSENKHLSFEANTIYNLGSVMAEGGGDEPEKPEDPKQSHSIYLYKHKNTWSEVKLYSWDAAATAYNGEWPGEAPVREEMINGHRYLVWDMAEEADGVELNILINDGKAEGGEQSADYSLGKFDGDRYILLNGKTLSDIEDKRDPIPVGEPEDPGSGDVPVGDGYKIYVYQHNNSWPLNLYTWDDNDTRYTGDWPGCVAQTTETFGDFTYQVWQLPTEAKGANLYVLLNGGGDDTKTEDFALGTFDGDHYLLLDGRNISEVVDREHPVATTPDVPDTPDTPDTPAVGEEYGGWGLVGEHQGWDIANPTPMYKTSTDGLYVCQNVTLQPTGFKFARRGLENWDTPNTYFGAWKGTNGEEYFDFMAEMDAGSWYDVYDNNLGEHATNIGVSDWSKSYDVYLRVVEHAEWGEHLAYTIVEHGTTVSF